MYIYIALLNSINRAFTVLVAFSDVFRCIYSELQNWGMTVQPTKSEQLKMVDCSFRVLYKVVPCGLWMYPIWELRPRPTSRAALNGGMNIHLPAVSH